MCAWCQFFWEVFRSFSAIPGIFKRAAEIFGDKRGFAAFFLSLPPGGRLPLSRGRFPLSGGNGQRPKGVGRCREATEGIGKVASKGPDEGTIIECLLDRRRGFRPAGRVPFPRGKGTKRRRGNSQGRTSFAMLNSPRPPFYGSAFVAVGLKLCGGGRRAGEDTRPYGRKQSWDVGSVNSGADLEPHQEQILQTQGPVARREVRHPLKFYAPEGFCQPQGVTLVMGVRG